MFSCLQLLEQYPKQGGLLLTLFSELTSISLIHTLELSVSHIVCFLGDSLSTVCHSANVARRYPAVLATFRSTPRQVLEGSQIEGMPSCV